jgi:hypothetical protein
MSTLNVQLAVDEFNGSVGDFRADRSARFAFGDCGLPQ